MTHEMTSQAKKVELSKSKLKSLTKPIGRHLRVSALIAASWTFIGLPAMTTRSHSFQHTLTFSPD